MIQRIYTVNNNEKQKIIDEIREVICTEKEIIFAYIHGSFLQERGFHDIDVAVFTEEPLSGDLFDYEFYLSSLLEKKLKLPVDIRALNHAPVGFRYEVTAGKVIFSRDEEKRFSFVERTWSEYLDYKPVAESILRDLAG
jgi:predicted nucleotidyltransferase